MSKLRKALRKVLFALLILFLLIVAYGIYVSPVFIENGGGGCLNDERRYGSHSDYIWGLRWIKWRDTVICGIAPPIQDSGNQDYHDHRGAPKPIPPAGEWQWSHAKIQTKYWNVRLDYVAITLPGRYHARLGWRWDDIDNVYLFSLSIKRIQINMDLQLLYWETQHHLA